MAEKIEVNTSVKNKLISDLKTEGKILLKDRIFQLSFLSLFIKSCLLLLFVMLYDSYALNNQKAAFRYLPSYYSITLYCFFILLFLSFSFLFKGRKKMWFMIFLNSIISAIMIFDLWYYRGYNSFLSFNLLSETGNLHNLSGSVLSMTRWYDLLFIADIIVFILIALIKRNMYKDAPRSINLFAVFFIVSLIYTFYTPFKVGVLNMDDANISIYQIKWQPKITMGNLSPIGYHIVDAYECIEDSMPSKLTDNGKKEIKSWYAGNKENLPDNKYKGLFKGKNLVIIQVESLEQFVINQKVDGQEITPNLNRILKNSYYFSNINEQVYNGTSSDSDLMINTSLLPIRRGSVFFRFPNNAYNSLPKLMEKQGYSTIAIHPDNGAYWNWLPNLTDMGFQKCIDSSHYKMDESIGLGISDGSFFRQIEPYVKSEKQPFYSFIVTLTSHSPYDLPEKYKELKLSNDYKNTFFGDYCQIIHYTDKQLGIFLNKLKNDGLYNNTLFVIAGDHTSLHKYYQQYLDTMKPSEPWFAKPNKRIPLIIYNPSITGKQIDTVGGQVDIMPTVAYLMGLNKDKYDWSVMGRNLLDTDESFAVLEDGTYAGSFANDKEKKHAMDSLNIADKIITTDYFKDNK